MGTISELLKRRAATPMAAPVASVTALLARSALSGHYPAWLPAHTVEVVDQDAGGRIRARLLESGGAAMVLATFGVD